MIAGPMLVPCVVMRGGTTRGFFFQAKDLPLEAELRDEALFSVIAGSGSCQADGLGGNDLVLSKVALVSPSKRPGIDIDVVFGAITPGSRRIKYGSNCGNLISAAALYSIEEGLAPGDSCMVRMFNPDSKTVVEARILSEDAGAGLVKDRCEGLPRTGVGVEVAFIEPDSTIGRGPLPTGRPADVLTLEDGREIEVSIVDSGTVYVFVRAADMPDHGRPEELLKAAEHLRSLAAVRIGLVAAPEDARRVTPNVPKVAFVSPATDGAADADIHARIVSSQSFHGAYAVTGAIATIAAAVTPDSVVNRLVRKPVTDSFFSCRIAHPGGVIEPRVKWRAAADGIAIERAYIFRTARRLMHGLMHVPGCTRG